MHVDLVGYIRARFEPEMGSSLRKVDSERLVQLAYNWSQPSFSIQRDELLEQALI
jgi:hypothetical protein